MDLLLVGCGHLGKALLKGWSSHRIFRTIIVVKPTPLDLSFMAEDPSITIVKDSSFLPKEFTPTLSILAIKPQTFVKAVQPLLPWMKESPVVSLLAALPIERLRQLLGERCAIVRLMPNLLIEVGRSLHLAFTTPMIDQIQSKVQSAFQNSGELIWLNQEEILDRLTPISGSGPAYFFLLAEILLQETRRAGISEQQALNIVQQLFLGAAKIAEQRADFSSLIKEVASKGGVTEAALSVMREPLIALMSDALRSAWQRIEEMKDENCR